MGYTPCTMPPLSVEQSPLGVCWPKPNALLRIAGSAWPLTCGNAKLLSGRRVTKQAA
ncbi:hypothetical protein AVU96_gp049 [Mycobacterium phage Snenia]|uniref:hypothetical protein n=1 Tax=Mycobacterium phage Snenia TaxID=1698714 RepID=UPI0006CE4143|nr:hypothetical protein AVU96_gp049 [Mycobacterium phage Snenia]ALF01586.1 hypothetical protein SNENIA_140 [Mycobacterium phage Snenia]